MASVTSVRDRLVDGARRVAGHVARYRDREILQYVDELKDVPVDEVSVQVYPVPHTESLGAATQPEQYCVAVTPDGGPSYRHYTRGFSGLPSGAFLDTPEQDAGSLRSRAEHRARRIVSRLEDEGIEATIDILEPEDTGHDLKASL